MARFSNIEWTDHTFNPWWGCTKISAACDNCYAETWARRMGFDIWTRGKPRRFLSDAYWQQPHQWNDRAASDGQRARVFCASMADVFEWRGGLRPWRERLWRIIDETPNLDWLLLTKRPHLAVRLSPWGEGWPDNVWVGTTVEDQRWAEKRLPKLAEIPATVRFLSCEPLLGPVELGSWLAGGDVHWVIAGGESGPHARPTDPLWFLDLLNQCRRHGIPFHFKQWGEWAPVGGRDAGGGNALPKSVTKGGAFSSPLGRFGKKASGRNLAGRTWDGVPGDAATPTATTHRRSFVRHHTVETDELCTLR